MSSGLRVLTESLGSLTPAPQVRVSWEGYESFSAADSSGIGTVKDIHYRAVQDALGALGDFLRISYAGEHEDSRTDAEILIWHLSQRFTLR